jgi:hypothetical protein
MEIRWDLGLRIHRQLLQPSHEELNFVGVVGTMDGEAIVARVIARHQHLSL